MAFREARLRGPGVMWGEWNVFDARLRMRIMPII